VKVEMRYLFLINKSEAQYEALSEEARARLNERYAAYAEKMLEAGVIRAGGMLEHTTTATTVRKRGNKCLVTDGPFAETVEQVAAFAIIEVADLDEAIAWATDHPDAECGSVEVRPLIEWRD
jgi:hypothetical protein